MSEILSNIVVQQIEATFQPDVSNLSITPNAISLNIYTGSAPGGGLSSNTELLFNNNNLIDGIPTATYANGNLSLGNVANLKIAGGTNGYFLQTDGAGNLDWAAAGGGGNGSPGGSNTQVQYNDNGTFGGNAGFTFNEVTGQLSVIDLSAGNAGITGSLSAGTLSAGNLNVTGNTLTQNMNSNANVIGVNFTANGNISVSGNANITGNVSANKAILSNISVSSNVIHLGNNAGNTGLPGIAIGDNAGRNANGLVAVAIGAYAANNGSQFGGIAIGTGAGSNTSGEWHIAIGAEAGKQVTGNFALAIGVGAGANGQGEYSVALGAGAGTSNAPANNTIVFNATGANLAGNAFANAFYVKPVRNANTANLMFYNPTTGELSYDTQSNITVGVAQTVSNNAQPNITSVGTLTGLTISGNLSSGNANLGNAVTANFFIGSGNNLSNIQGANVIGTIANATTANTVRNNAQPNITSVGTLTSLVVTGNIGGGNLNTGGSLSVTGNGSIAGKLTLFSPNIGLGLNAGSGQGSGSVSVAIGQDAGKTSQGNRAVAIGFNAGTTSQSDGAVAIGWEAGKDSGQGVSAVAIGQNSGSNNQGNYSVAIGLDAGENNQGDYSIAIGTVAGRNNQSINSIVINATGSNLEANTANALFVKPVRNAATANVLYYNNTTGEISYNSASYGQFSSNVTQTNSNVGNAVIATFNTDEGSSGVSIVSNTQITTSRVGWYNIQFSAQMEKTDSGTDNVEIWLKKNGTNVARSAGDVELQGNGAKSIVAWNWLVESANVNDYYQIAWASTDANIRVAAVASANTLSGVDIPSWIVTVVPVGI